MANPIVGNSSAGVCKCHAGPMSHVPTFLSGSWTRAHCQAYRPSSWSHSLYASLTYPDVIRREFVVHLLQMSRNSRQVRQVGLASDTAASGRSDHYSSAWAEIRVHKAPLSPDRAHRPMLFGYCTDAITLGTSATKTMTSPML